MSLFQQADLTWNEPPCSAAVGLGARGAAAGRPAGGSRGPPPRALPQGRSGPVRTGPLRFVRCSPFSLLPSLTGRLSASAVVLWWS